MNVQLFLPTYVIVCDGKHPQEKCICIAIFGAQCLRMLVHVYVFMVRTGVCCMFLTVWCRHAERTTWRW